MKKLSILGSTGSIGQSTLDVVSRHPERFSVAALAEGHDVELLSRQIELFSPKLVSVRDEESAKRLSKLIGARKTEIMYGMKGTCEVASMADADMVVSAIVGAAGLIPTISAINAGKDIALANKETMVAAGRLVSNLARAKGVSILPVDSEHAAIHQSLAGHRHQDLSSIILTASGGPFLRSSIAEMKAATPAQASVHPRWSMGAKITVDSATMMNKGLEVIEAHWLFDVPAERIRVLIHPQSIVHSLVEYCDGCVMAQLGVPDMRAPIAYAISWPERIESGVERLDLARAGSLTFEEPDLERFPCLSLAYRALAEGGSMPAAMNAANEVAVAAFLSNRVGFMEIGAVVEKTMSAHKTMQINAIDDVLEADRWARAFADKLIS